ncbi:hypothetical protein L7F22_048372 [Adiantum nelumboides]|nr:hypothetical protein [Adiantum nelumboides]
MHKANVQNDFYITSNDVNSISSTFRGAGIKMGNFWQPWIGADGELCGQASYLDCFTGIANTYELAFPAEWIGDDYILAENVGSLCDTHTFAQRLDTLSFPSLEQSDKFVFGLNGLINSLPNELLCHIFVAIGKGCSNLLSLSVRGCPLIGDYGIISAVCNLKRLKRMKLDGLVELEGATFIF